MTISHSSKPSVLLRSADKLIRQAKLIVAQIGDPKMDSGALEPGETLEEEFDMDKEFLPEELIWLMDEMLNREVRCPTLRSFLLLTR